MDHADDAAISTPERVIGKPFPKGVSPNPSGRPRQVLDVIKENREHVGTMLTKLRALALTASDEKVQVSAIHEFLDRVIGKATVRIGGDSEADPIRLEAVGPIRSLLARMAADDEEDEGETAAE